MNHKHLIDKDFLSRENFDEVTERISRKISSHAHYLEKKDFAGSDLKLILQNSSYFYESILSYFEKNNFVSSPFNKIQIITNKKRDIYTSTWSERIIFMMAQNTLARSLEEILIPEVFSFRKGKGPFTARDELLSFIQRHNSDLYLLQGDIKSYGDNINQEILLNLLKEDLGIPQQSRLYQVISQSVNIHFQDKQEISQMNHGIPSGSPLVPALENLYLHRLDKKIKAISGIFYARYGDDFLFLHPENEKIQQGISILDEELVHKKLEIKKEKKIFCLLTKKTHLLDTPFKRYFSWIGFSFHHNGRSQIKENHFKVSRAQVHQEINNYFKKLAKTSCLTEKDISLSLQYSLRIIYGQNQFIKKLIKDSTDEGFVKIFIENEVKFVKKMIQFHLKKNSRAAWKIVRSCGLNIEFFL